jgi:hypothetical protein
VQELPCQCITYAGTVNNQIFNVCLPDGVSVPYNGNATLSGDDILRYILFSNVNNITGSIIVQSSSPDIAFNPALMQTGVTYYLATLAGNNLNGNVDLSDPCLDISDLVAQVIWREKPTVSFSIPGDPNVCAGECRTIMANLVGSPPFSLSYTTFFGTFTQSFFSTPGFFEVCVPADAEQGPLTIQAGNVSDNWCVCN